MYYLVNQIYQELYHSIDFEKQQIQISMGGYLSYIAFDSLATIFERLGLPIINGKCYFFLAQVSDIIDKDNNIWKIEKLYSPEETQNLFTKMIILL